MSWTWDSTEITHDQTCWTYDGYNGCSLPEGSSGGIDLIRANKDDRDMLEILSMIMNYSSMSGR